MYYLRQQTRVSGPFSPEQMRTLLHKGRVARSDKISTDRVTWRAIGECPELVERPAAAAAEPAATEPAVVDPVAAGAEEHEWFYAVGGVQQPSSIGTAALRRLIATGQVGPSDVVWRTGFADWQPVSTVGDLADASAGAAPVLDRFPAPHPAPFAVPSPPPGRTAGRGGSDYESFVAKKMPAGLLAILLGPLGIHKFMLGLTTGGLVMLGLCFLIAPIPVLSIIALIEGVTYLTKSEADFYNDYAIRKKQWL